MTGDEQVAALDALSNLERQLPAADRARPATAD
jgi:hypothetical protein